MSTDALREARQQAIQKVSTRYEEAGKWRVEYRTKDGAIIAITSFQSASQAAAQIVGMLSDFRVVLAAPASETLEKKYATGLQWAAANPEDAKEMLEAVRPSEMEKLPAKWRKWAATGMTKHVITNWAKTVMDLADELEAALKADRVGAPTSKP